jgi:uncharacterized protein YukE
MDLLDRVHPVAAPLLARVDATLVASGAAAGHPIWPLLRRLGALPGELVASFAETPPDGLTAASDAMHGTADGYRARVDEVPMPAAWQGSAADAYGASWSGFSGHVGAMADRLADTAAYLDEVTAWRLRARRALAGTVAECLGSAEAVALTGSGDVVAAAMIGAHILATAAEVLDDGRALSERWSSRLGEVAFRPSAPTPAGGSSLRLG